MCYFVVVRYFLCMALYLKHMRGQQNHLYLKQALFIVLETLIQAQKAIFCVKTHSGGSITLWAGSAALKQDGLNQRIWFVGM